MEKNCNICKAVLTPGHIPKMHPPKFLAMTSSKTTPEGYMRMMREKGYVWDEANKKWNNVGAA